MEENKTPEPGSEDYNPNQPQELNMPKYNSSTDKRGSSEIPAAENLNDEKDRMTRPEQEEKPLPDTSLGNKRDDDENEKERIIRR